MCYICNCFAWTLDLVQRFITFALGCVMSLAICCGLAVAILAGVAYGYNYSLAEFLTFARSDVTVYMRRGQFLDKPDLQPSRRSGDNTYDLLSSNITSDYQEESGPIDTNPLSNTWVKAEDTRRYAEKLTKYSSQLKEQQDKEKLLQHMMRPESLSYYKLATPPRLISILPNRWASTTGVQSGRPEMILRRFRPVEQLPSSVPQDYYANFDNRERPTVGNSKQTTEVDTTKVKKEDDSTNSDNAIKHWHTTENPHIIIEYGAEDTDEDNIVYKPV